MHDQIIKMELFQIKNLLKKDQKDFTGGKNIWLGLLLLYLKFETSGIHFK